MSVSARAELRQRRTGAWLAHSAFLRKWRRQSPRGTRQWRKNWSFFFTTIPDIQVEILNEVAEGDTVWAELHYHGTQTDGKKFTVRGVTLLGIQADQIVWARLYIEPVQELN